MIKNTVYTSTLGEWILLQIVDRDIIFDLLKSLQDLRLQLQLKNLGA